MHRQIISDFRGETRPIAEVIDEYLAKSDSLMKPTAEGRAFEGAFTLLRDEPLLVDLRSCPRCRSGASFAPRSRR
jgi:hypothetical protein